MTALVRVAWLTLGLLFGCYPADTPTQAAEGYLSALSRLDFEAAAHFADGEGQGTLKHLRQLYSSLSTDERKKFQISTWTLGEVSVSGDTALVTFTFDGTKTGELRLHRVRTQWRVDYRPTF